MRRNWRDAGDAGDARLKFEAVLARSAAETPGETLHLPPELEAVPDPAAGLGGLAIFYRAVSAPPSPKPVAPGRDDHILRLRAIRELACLLPAPNGAPGAMDPRARDARSRWQEHWKQQAAAGLRSEPLQAFYSSGDVPGTMDLLAGGMSTQQPAEERLRAAFLLAGCMEDYGRLRVGRGSTASRARAWPGACNWSKPCSNSSPTGAGPARTSPARCSRLRSGRATSSGEPRSWGSPSGAGIRRRPNWASACWRWRRPAVPLTRRRWRDGNCPSTALTGRGPAPTAIDEEGGGPWRLGRQRGLRGVARLLPALAFGRAARLRRNLSARVAGPRRARPPRPVGPAPPRSARSEADARQDVDALLALRLAEPENGDHFSEARRWSYLLETGVQLENWNLGSLAASLWRKSLDGPTAFDRADPEVQGTLAEISNRLMILDVARAASPEASRECMTQYLAGRPRTDLVRAAASQFLAASEFPAARQLYEISRARSRRTPRTGAACWLPAMPTATWTRWKQSWNPCWSRRVSSRRRSNAPNWCGTSPRSARVKATPPARCACWSGSCRRVPVPCQ